MKHQLETFFESGFKPEGAHGWPEDDSRNQLDNSVIEQINDDINNLYKEVDKKKDKMKRIQKSCKEHQCKVKMF